MPDTTHDALTIAKSFNEAVEATAIVGALKADLDELKADARETRRDVKHIRSSIDRWGGVAVVVSALISAATGLVMYVAGQAIVRGMFQ